MSSLSNTGDAGDALEMDLERLTRHLAEAGKTLDSSFLPTRFTAGFGNMNFLVRVDCELMVLRRPPPGPIPPGANDMEREYSILHHLHPVFPLVPRARHFCGDPGVIGAPFLLMEYRPGLVIGSAITTDAVNGWQGEDPIGRILGRRMIDVLADLHAVDAKNCGLGMLGKPAGFLERNLRGWGKRANLAWVEAAPGNLQAVLDWLVAHVPLETGKSSLIHNDFKLDNIILDPDTFEPRTLIDWDMGTLGDPLYDLAVLLSYWTEISDPQAMHSLRQMPTAGHGFPSREEAADQYARASGRTLRDFTFHRVLATLRLAVVFQQLFRRYETGGTDDPAFAMFDDLARGLLDFAIRISRGQFF